MYKTKNKLIPHILNKMFKQKTKQKYDTISSNGPMAERLRRRSRKQKVPSSIPHLGISFEENSQC